MLSFLCCAKCVFRLHAQDLQFGHLNVFLLMVFLDLPGLRSKSVIWLFGSPDPIYLTYFYGGPESSKMPVNYNN